MARIITTMGIVTIDETMDAVKQKINHMNSEYYNWHNYKLFISVTETDLGETIWINVDQIITIKK